MFYSVATLFTSHIRPLMFNQSILGNMSLYIVSGLIYCVELIIEGLNMCNCMDRVAEELNSKLAPKVTEGGVISYTETGWDNKMLDFSSGKFHVMLNYKFAYRAKKKNGEMAKNLTRLDTVVKMSHCPFCGEKQS